MVKITGGEFSEKYTTPAFAEPNIDEQIDNLKFFHSRRMAELEREYQQRLEDMQEDYARKMQNLLEQKAQADHPVATPTP